jgi:ubiquinone/menaquinone biosynthesis C-methylase UbiE
VREEWRAMIERKPLGETTFRDVGAARRYNEEGKRWLPGVCKSLVAVVSQWDVTAGSVLDVGTGTGLLAIEFVRHLPGMALVGLDLSGAALEVANENLREMETPLSISFEQGDAEDMPFSDRMFDLVISSNTLHLIDRPVKMFDEIQRVLKPGGRFLVTDFRRSWLGLLTQHIRASYSPQEVMALLRESTLRNWKVTDSLLWLTVLSGD